MWDVRKPHQRRSAVGVFPVKKVTSSHKKGKTVILTETDIGKEQLHAAIEPTGYRVLRGGGKLFA